MPLDRRIRISFRAIPSLRWLNFRRFPVVPPSAGQSFSHESMAAEHKACGAQSGLPAVLRPDRRRVTEQPVFFLLLGQPGELGAEGMIGRQKRLLAMENRRIRAGGIIEAVDLAGAERELDAAMETRVRVGLEFGIDEVRNLTGMAVQLDQVGPVESAEVGSGASLVDTQ
jgi:hypothetical protein